MQRRCCRPARFVKFKESMSQPKKPRFIIEIAGGGLVFVVAALVWKVALAPQPDHNPEMDAAPVPGSVQPMPGWGAASTKQAAAAKRSIEAQVDAFRKDDYERAVFYQSSSLRRNFPSIAAFRTMMKSRYPQFASPAGVAMGSSRVSADGQHMQVAVRVTGTDGVKVRAVYSLVMEDGIFHVEGVSGGQAAPPSSPIVPKTKPGPPPNAAPDSAKSV